ncbi:unnamed protein product, partial [Mesorhabditis spiculigera]
MYALKAAGCVALLGHAVYQFEHNPSWWLYCPSYVSAALLSLLPFPNSYIWKLLSSISVIGGGLFMLFLAYTFHKLDGTIGLVLDEGKALLPVSMGVFLIASTRLTYGHLSSPVEYLRGFILTAVLFASVLCAGFSIKYLTLEA